MTPSTAGGASAAAVASLMPQLKAELARLVAIPGVSVLGYPEQTRAALDRDARRGGRAAARRRCRADRHDRPARLGARDHGRDPGPPGAPTVLLYGHYDIAPVGEESKWESPPYEATRARRRDLRPRRGRLEVEHPHAHRRAARLGRPAAGRHQARDRGPGGNRQRASRRTRRRAPSCSPADAMVIADMGSVRPGVPTLTVGLRGMAAVIVEVRTLAGPKHSGQFGGAAPDALVALIHALASLHDEDGDVVVTGLRREPWTGASYSEEEFRELGRGRARHAALGHGRPRRARLVRARRSRSPASTRSRWTGPSTRSSPYARAKVSIRIHPAQDPAEAQAALVRHLEGAAAVRARAEVSRPRPARASSPRPPARPTRRRAAALATAWGSETVQVATGGSIPLVSALSEAVPDGRDPAVRHHRRLREHPRAERARAGGRVRAGRRRRGRVLPRSTPARGAGHERRRSRRRGAAASPARCSTAIETARQQGAAPGDDVLRALRLVILLSSVLALRSTSRRHLRGRRGAADRRVEEISAARRSPVQGAAASTRAQDSRSTPRRPRSRACSRSTGSGSSSRRS